MYEFVVHTYQNESKNEDSAVFITLIGKEGETKKFLLQFADNVIHPLQSNQTDIFYFLDRDVSTVCDELNMQRDNRIHSSQSQFVCHMTDEVFQRTGS